MRVLYKAFICFLIVLSLPFMAVACLAIAFTSGFPFLFTQIRVGKKGQKFTLYKFRTMIRGADGQQKELTPLNEAHGPVFKIHNDPRYTRIGKFLAHTGLDELPQLFNVFLGDMAIIGPRPLPVAEAKKLKPWQRKRYEIKPGIISPWILEGYHTQTFDVWMKSDITYIKKKSFLYDLSLAGRTVSLLVRLFVREILPS